MGSKTTTKQTNTPYDPAAIKGAQTALTGAYDQSKASIAQNSPALQGAINQIQSNIAAPPKYFTDARAQLDKTINGAYLDPASNPYASGMAKLIADRTQGNYNSTFGASGRSHGGLAALLSSQGVGDALNNFYGNIYNSERGMQQGATMAAPAFNSDEYTGINALFPAVGNAAMLPLNAANSYAGGMGQLLEPYKTSTQTQRTPFGLQQGIGLAMMAAGAATGNPGMAMGGAQMAGGGGQSAMPMMMSPSAYGGGGFGNGGGGMAPIIQGGGTSAYFAQHPFGGSTLGYFPGFGG